MGASDGPKLVRVKPMATSAPSKALATVLGMTFKRWGCPGSAGHHGNGIFTSDTLCGRSQGIDHFHVGRRVRNEKDFLVRLDGKQLMDNEMSRLAEIDDSR